MRKIFCIVVIAAGLNSPLSGQVSQVPDSVYIGEAATAVDSSLAQYTIEELVEFREYYSAKTDSLLAEKNELRLQAISDLEHFLENNPNSSILDRVMIRLAELQYQQAVYDYSQALESVSQTMANDSTVVAEPELDYSRAIALYKRVLQEFPQSSLVDDALYNQAFLYEDLGQPEKGFNLFQQLVQRFPDSRFVPDALMRMAEYHFNPPDRDLDKAIALYQRLLDYKESSRYDAALYRLGWAYYILNDYPRAIAYFTTLADDIERVKELDPGQQHHFPLVRDEAVEYIGISFLDFGGPQNAAGYFDEIGGREYGFEVLKKIGDAYMDVKEEYANAIESYELMLDIYPNAPSAPQVQARIAEAYRSLENEGMAYAQRSELYKKYRSGSEWWENVSDPAVKTKATELAEQALRDNIQMLLQQAEKTGNQAQYRQAVTDAREYLKVFPYDSNTVRIHWNLAVTLDTKLDKKDEAFEEYIEISNTYWGSDYQKRAARNAIAIMDDVLRPEETGPTSLATLASSEKAAADSVTDRRSQPQELTAAEEKMSLALNNYIQLFPHEPETSKILSKAGALYYERRQFDEALKYFKTVAKQFPQSEEADDARYLTMESYFGKGDYESAELIARTLREQAPQYAANANKRMGEAIFMQADALADSSDHLKAAEEYRRMVQETPTVGFADRALFKAAQEYEKGEHYKLAVESYNQLINDYPQSEHYLSALNNMAFDYRELENYGKAAETYERLATTDTSRENAQVALYNASVSYVQAEEWLRAIQVNNRYVERFPDSDDADDLLFNNASYYLKLNDLKNAERIYASFVEKFPDSPRVVEAFYRRGDYFRRNNDAAQAQAQFAKAVAKNTDFKQQGKQGNDFYASEALFHLTEMKYDEFEAIEFNLPEEALARSKERKKQLLSELVDNYTKVAGFGTFRVYQATYRIGSAYEEFAETWVNQEIPETDETRRIVARKEINSVASGLFEKGVNAYKKGVRALAKLAAASQDTAAARTPSVKLDELARQDSTAAAAEKWIARCKEKVSENLYTMAKIQNQALEQLLAAPKPEGLNQLEELVYDQQVLVKAVAPLTQQVADAHARNLHESQELDLTNQWTRKSGQELLRVSGLLPQQFQELSREAFSRFQENVKGYDRSVGLDPDAAYELGDKVSGYLDLTNNTSLAAAKTYREQIRSIRELGIDSLQTEQFEQAMMGHIVRYASTADSLLGFLEARRDYYDRKFQETDNPDFEDAYFVFDDAYFSLKERSLEAMKFGYETSEALYVTNESTRKLIPLLLKRAPDQYAEELGIEIVTSTITSTADWAVSLETTEGWTNVDFPDSLWHNAIPDPEQSQIDGQAVARIWYASIADLNNGESDGVQGVTQSGNGEQSGVQLVRPKKLYFRKVFEIGGQPISGTIQLQVDDTYALYANGELVADVTEQGGEQQGSTKHNLDDYLRRGENVIAVAVTDSDNSHGGLAATIEVRYLGNSLSDEKSGIEKVKFGRRSFDNLQEN